MVRAPAFLAQFRVLRTVAFDFMRKLDHDVAVCKVDRRHDGTVEVAGRWGPARGAISMTSPGAEIMDRKHLADLVALGINGPQADQIGVIILAFLGLRQAVTRECRVRMPLIRSASSRVVTPFSVATR